MFRLRVGAWRGTSPTIVEFLGFGASEDWQDVTFSYFTHLSVVHLQMYWYTVHSLVTARNRSASAMTIAADPSSRWGPAAPDDPSSRGGQP